VKVQFEEWLLGSLIGFRFMVRSLLAHKPISARENQKGLGENRLGNEEGKRRNRTAIVYMSRSPYCGKRVLGSFVPLSITAA